MNKKEVILDLLKDIKSTVNLADVTDIIDGNYLDSMELMSLIGSLCDVFDIEIELDDIIPENFNSVQAMADMVDMVQKRGN